MSNLSLGSLLGDDEPDGEDLPGHYPDTKTDPTGSEELGVSGHSGAIKVFDGPVNTGRWLFDPTVEFLDWDRQCIIPNPHWVPRARELDEPHPKNCPVCREEFWFSPTTSRGRVVLEINRRCPECEETRELLKYHLRTRQTPITYPTLLKNTPIITRNEAVLTDRPPESLGPQGHAKHGPSSLKHKEICPHYLNGGGTNPVAEEGTMLHERLQIGNIEGLKDEQRHAVEMVAGLFNALSRELGTNVVEMVERRVNVAEETWGTADIIMMSQDGTRAKIADAKFGWNPVDDAELNLQGWCYSVGVFYEFPHVREVEVVFAQPRCDEVSRHLFTREHDYHRMLLRIQTTIARAEDPEAPYNAVPENCTWCANKARCPALHTLALKVAPIVDLEKSFAIPAELDPKLMEDPAMVSRARAIAELMGSWVEAVKERANELAKEGVEIPGWRLIEKSTPREITDPGAALNLAMSDYDVKLEDVLTAVKKVSLPDLEKLVAAGVKRGLKEQTKQKFEDQLRDADAIRAEGTVTYLKKEKQQQPQLIEA